MRRLLAIGLLVAVLSPAAAMADSSVLPDPNAGLPWTDPAHHSPLEQFAATIASQIAGRQVSVTCYGDTDWATVAQQRRFDPSVELGFVPSYYWPSTGTIAYNADQMFLSPRVCLALQQFGFASTKPTKCQQTVTTTNTTYLNKRFRVAVWKVVDGRRVKRHVWRTKRVAQTTTTSSLGPPAPCYGAGGVVLAGDTAYWQSYLGYVYGLWTLAHEAIHQREILAGVPLDSVQPTAETHATCYGLQLIPWVAEQFGATPDDARAIADFAYDRVYPHYQGLSANGSPYWSADCRQDGPLDQTPGDTLWP